MITATLTMNPAVDVSSTVAAVFPNHKLRCDAPRREPGGGGINVAMAMNELGEACRALFPCGGPQGQLFLDLLRSREVDQVPIEIKGHTRSNVTISDESTGEQYRFVMPGPNLAGDEVQACLDAVRGLDPAPDALVASGSLPPGAGPQFMADLAALAREIGCRLIVDTSGEPLKEALAQGVYLVKPNMRELRDLAQRDVSTEKGQEAALMELVHEGACQVVVLSLGAAGVCLATEDGCERLRAPTVEIVSRVGAGDSTIAGILVGLTRGYSIRDAVRLGVAAGSAAVMTPGTELCRRSDVERLFEGDDHG